MNITTPEKMAAIINSYAPYFSSFMQKALLAFVAKQEYVSPGFYNKLKSLVNVSRDAEAPIKPSEIEELEDMYA